MADKNIPIARVIPANYFNSRNRRTNERGGAGSKRASVSVDLGSKNSGGKGNGTEPTGPASRMTGGMADGVEGPPQIEGQEAIANQSRMPRFSVGNPNVGQINLGSLMSERPNEAFDSSKPIGGENVPYKATKGVGGFFRRVFGDQSNERNLEAQGNQAANWRQEDAEVRKQAREDAIEERRAAREEERYNKRTQVEDRRIADEAERARIRDANKWVQDNEEYEARAGAASADREIRKQALADEKKSREDLYELQKQGLELQKGKVPKKEPRFNSLGGGILEDISTGEVFMAREGSPARGKIPAVQGGLVPLGRITPPPRAGAGPQVDPATGRPLAQTQVPASAAAAQPSGSMGASMDMPEETTSLRVNPPRSFEMPDVGPPDLMTQYNMRAKELTAGSRETPETAMSPLTRPLYSNMAALLNVQPGQVGASRFSNVPEDVVASDLDKYLEQFGKIPEEYQRYAVDDALQKSYEESNLKNRKDPRSSGWSYK